MVVLKLSYCLQFYTFEACKVKVREKFPDINPNMELGKLPLSSLHIQYLLYCWAVANFGVGTVAGGVAAFACHPLDVIRTRFVGQGEPKVRA